MSHKTNTDEKHAKSCSLHSKKLAFFFLIRRFENKNAHFEEKILIFEKRADYFLTIFCSVLNIITELCFHVDALLCCYIM